jgi:hypothetical protein
MTNVRVELYSNVALTTLVASNTSGDFTWLTASTPYYAVTVWDDVNESTWATETKRSTALSVTTDSPSNVPGSIATPSLESKTSTTINTAPWAVTGMTNVRVELYSNVALTTLVASNTSGDFTWLTASTPYYAVTVWDDVNESTWATETKRSTALSVTTDSPSNVPGSIATPSLESKTSTTINTAPWAVTGMTNVRVELYSNVALTTLVASNTSGDFTWLTASTPYYAVTVWDDVNESTWATETKRSTALSVTTDSPSNVPGSIATPSLESKTSTTINTAPWAVTGMTNVRVELYSNVALTTLVASNTSGDFTWLTASTPYYAVTVWDDVNESTWATETKRSTALSVTTDSPSNVPGSIATPSLESKTSTTINTAPWAVTGMTNVRVELYSNVALTTLVASNTSGDFTWLTASTPYYAVTVWDDVNESTWATETKRSTALSVTTDSPSNVPGSIATTTDPTVSYNVDLNAELQSEGVYRYPTSVSNFTLSSLSANDPEGIGSYTIISSLFGTLANWSGSLPSTVTTWSSVGKFLQTETITITVSDVGTPTRTTTKTITIVYDI